MESGLNILAVSRTSPFHGVGGFEDHIRTVYSGLVARGHNVTVLTTAHPEGVSHSQSEGVTYEFLPTSKPGRYCPKWWDLSAKRTTEFLSKNKVDIIHSQSYSAAEVFKQGIAKKRGIPTAVSFHGTSFDEYKTSNNLTQYEWKPLVRSVDYFQNYLKWRSHVRRLDTPCLQNADCVIATSNEQRDIFETIYHVPPQKIATVFNGMSVEQFIPLEKPSDMVERFGLEDAFIVGCLARLEPDKGVQYVIQAFPDVVKLIPKAKLVIVGSGSYEKHLRHLVSRLALDKAVVFVGKVPFEKVGEALCLFDVFINLTIRQNGYDLTMVEAMACERPVIASHIGSHPTLIQHNKTGFLIPLHAFSTLKDVLLSLYQNPPLQKEIGQNARHRILESFTDTAMVSQTELCFKALHDAKH